MGDIDFSVLEVGIANEPHVSNEIRSEIEGKDGGKGSGLSPQIEQVEHSKDSDDGENQLRKHLVGE